MSSAEPRPVLVAGASGLLGGAIARQLLAAGIPIRAMSRSSVRLEALAALGAEPVVGDLQDSSAVDRAVSGVGQVVSTANNVMGSGDRSPMKVDLPAHQNLCASALRHRVERIVNVSAVGLEADSVADYFRVKFAVDQAIKRCGIPFVLLQPTVLMETWAETIIGDGIRRSNVATLFGDGLQRSNFIAVDDVASFAVRIIQDPTVRNETIPVGGPSTVSFEDLAALVEQRLGVSAKRRYVPRLVLRAGSKVLRPFFEVQARLMAMGYVAATKRIRLDDWRVPAERFGVFPRTIEEFVAARFGPSLSPA